VVFGYNHQYINDLPATSPHGSDSNTLRELLELCRFERRAWHSNATPERMPVSSKVLCVRLLKW
jgi:hypothetical protein